MRQVGDMDTELGSAGWTERSCGVVRRESVRVVCTSNVSCLCAKASIAE